MSTSVQTQPLRVKRVSREYKKPSFWIIQVIAIYLKTLTICTAEAT